MEKEIFEFQQLSNLCEGLKNIFISIIFKNGTGQNFFSSNLTKVTGYLPEEINAMPDKIYSLVCEEDLDLLKKNLAYLENDPSAYSTDLFYSIFSKSGKKIWLKESLKITRDHDGEIIKKQSTTIDITDIKEKELENEKKNYSLR